ncbi:MULTISPECIES: tonB-system energizer ExbB [unclassified Tardiphaga]|uniref:tonB-system energizer ExbB n=1 Tax=unclassified Tardiphaga TaxID=2631404 RepID=UPI0008A797B4|nr:tonB-system energizer ExbB [Tardiphaga sp. OK245]SEI07527.1 biopolymer transport protein ExbB [Tardiphaga sp. OK245]
MFRTVLKSLAVLAVVAFASPIIAQQAAKPVAPVVTQAAPAAAPAPVTAQPSSPVASPAASTALVSPVMEAAPRPMVATGEHDLSPWKMFMGADIIVKAVMVGLAFASVVTWTVGIFKMMELTWAMRRLKAALRKIGESRSLSEAQMALGERGTILSRLLAAAMREGRMSAGISSDEGIKERAASSFGEIVRAEGRKVRTGMGILATIGATSPFVGLFGTVWGIMNSFIGISKSQTTNLAVVAPGIAEALLATAIGLVAAIPAVIIYNHFSRVTKAYMEIVGRAQGAAGRLLSRDLDRTHSSSHARAAAE